MNAFTDRRAMLCGLGALGCWFRRSSDHLQAGKSLEEHVARGDFSVSLLGYGLGRQFLAHGENRQSKGLPRRQVVGVRQSLGVCPHRRDRYRRLEAFGYVLGFAEFADGAYRRFEEMAQMIVADIHARESGVRRELLDKLRESHFPDLRGGKAYIESPRHAAYVDKDAYRDVLMSLLRDFGWPALTDRSFEAMKADGAATTGVEARRHPVPPPHGSRRL